MELIEYLHNSPLAFVIVCGILGLAVGSFLNVVILRLPVMMERQWHSQCREFLEINDAKTAKQVPQTAAGQERFDLVYPSSHCPKCGHKITAVENIPVISYLLLKGKCSGCGVRIPFRYPLIEGVTGLLSVTVAWHFGFGWETGAALVLTWSLICLTVIDIDHQLLPDSITLPFLWLGLFASLYGIFTDSATAIMGALAGYLSLWSVYKLFKWTTGKEGMGYGDFKLLAMLGAWMGWKMVLPVILLSSLVGAVVGITMIVLRGRDKNIPIPFGPYLATAGWICLLWGKDIVRLYMDWMAI
jgi:leader peptidase (prepilin peptidase)/N-methyltransferase